MNYLTRAQAVMAVLSLASLSEAAFAAPCTSAPSSSSSSSFFFLAASPASCDDQPNKNAGLIFISSPDLETSQFISSSASAVVSGNPAGGIASLGGARFALGGSGRETGMAAAAGGSNWNTWIAYSKSNVEFNFEPRRTSGDVDVAIFGFDYRVSSSALVGVAFSWDKSDLDLRYTDGFLRSDGYTISPYAAFTLSPNWTIDMAFGFGKTDVDTRVISNSVSGSTDTDRRVGSLALTYRQAVGSNWFVSGRGAYLTSKNKYDGYTLSDTTAVPSATASVEQLRLGVQAAYNGGWFVPSFSLNYIHDLKRTEQESVGGEDPANDKNSMQAVLGLQFKSQGGLYGGIQFSHEFSRSEIKNDQFLINLGIRF